MKLHRREVLQGLGAAAVTALPMTKLALAANKLIAPPPYRCGPDCSTTQFTKMQTWNVGVSNTSLQKIIPSKAQLSNAADRIEQFSLMLQNNGHLAAFQTAVLAYFQNPTNFYGAKANATDMHYAFLNFGGNMTANDIQTELNKVQLGDRQAIVAYIKANGVKAYIQVLQTGLEALAQSDFREPNRAQRVVFGACLLFGGVLLFPEFAGVAAAVAIGEGLVVAGGIGTITLDLYGE